MENALKTLESKTSKIYREVLTPLGDAYHLEILTPRQRHAGKPTILFLGNHSSGKSTFINFLLGEAVQKTGIAPTDDGFTIICHGKVAEDSAGAAAARRPDITVTELDRFGPAFLSRLKLKLLTNDLLKTMTLVDSPGMIDAASTDQERGYDFMSAVRAFGESADLILFFFDPEKPGTTGEAIAAFTKALHGMEAKILILLNKADEFTNIRDFARDYGALCWNLSRVIATKDLPDIYTTFVPLEEAANQRDENRVIPLAGLEEAREEVVAHINGALGRRYDNVIGTLTEQAHRLDMHIRVTWDVKGKVLQARSLCATVTLCLFAGTTGLSWLFRNHPNYKIPLLLVCGGLLTTILWWAIGRLLVSRMEDAAVDGLESAFQRHYERDFTLGSRDDLKARWRSIKPHLESVLRNLGLGSMPAAKPSLNRRYRRLRKLLTTDIARLRAG